MEHLAETHLATKWGLVGKRKFYDDVETETTTAEKNLNLELANYDWLPEDEWVIREKALNDVTTKVHPWEAHPRFPMLVPLRACDFGQTCESSFY